ncbi:TetR/AcrR family transcriptional regulator [Sphingobium sp.]|uniref:TetR/AcrR family transcriptional regulator n=1 Tax=Sphingobium sp. TaxID=1912891 RepID=UPI0028BED4C2|nr:TetR/AcrR family transcriptional regulator [Sphingobium sp.]
MSVAAPSTKADARMRILDAAAGLFRLHGLAGTSMDAIAASARMSKRTLYACFPDKHAILAAVLDQFIGERYAAIELLCRGLSGDDAILLAMAQGLKDAATDDDALAMNRLLIAEAESLPELALAANRRGLEQAIALMREPFRNLGVDDSAGATRLLYDLVVLAPMHRRLVGADDLHLDVGRIVQIVLAAMRRPACASDFRGQGETG